MDLLDRYLQAVKKHLPWKRQDDIIAELRANLESQLEDKEEGLGRPLTTNEVQDWLREMGPPMQVAARYQPQQYLIGPAIFPMYWFVLRLAFFWSMIIYLIVSGVLLLVGENPSETAALEALLRVPVVLLSVATWVTLIFAALEFAVTHYPSKCPPIPGFPANWSPSTLPPVEKDIAPGKKPRTYATAVAEFVFGFLFLIWLLLIPRHPYLLMGPGAAYLLVSPFQLAPVWIQVFWCLIALNVFQSTWRCIDLLRGSWQRPQTAQHIAMSVLGLVPLLVVLNVRDHVSVVLKHPALDQLRYGGTLDTINEWVYRSLLLICAITVLQLAWVFAQMGLAAYRKRAASSR